MKNQSQYFLQTSVGLLLFFQIACSGSGSSFTVVDNSSSQGGNQSSGSGNTDTGGNAGGSNTGGGNTGGSTGGGSSTGGAGTVTNFKLTCMEAKFIKELNLYRTQNSLGTVKVAKSAVLAARWHAQNMIDLNYFAHYEPNGRDPFTRMRAFGYPGLAENASYGSASKTAFCQWKNSAGHNKNMLGASYTTTGIGRVLQTSTGFTYWSSNFGGDVTDIIAEPLTDDPQCVLPTTVPSC